MEHDSTIDGIMVKGKLQGHAVLYSGSLTKIYDGELKNSLFDGNGTFYFADGRTPNYVGHWMDSYRSGDGKAYHRNGNLNYDGNWQGNEPSGQGKNYSENGNLIYDGGFKNGKSNGHGIQYYSDGKYDGNWVDGVRSGYGKFYGKSGDLIYTGKWLNDNWNGQGTQYYDKTLFVDGDGRGGVRVIGTWRDNQPVTGAIMYAADGTPMRRWDGDKFAPFENTEQDASQQSVAGDTADSDADDSSNSHVGLQILGAALNTAIQARGMRDAAASQRASQAAANQQARANAAVLAQTQLAAARAQQVQAQAPHDAQIAQAQAAAAQVQAAAAQASASVAASHPKPAYVPVNAPPANPGYAQAPSSSPSGPPSFATSDQQHCDNSDDPLSCTYNVLVSNHGGRGISCTADVTLYRTNSVTGNTDQLSARDIGYVPANSTSTVSSNLAKGGSYNVNCTY